MKKKEHPNRQDYDINNEKLPFTSVFTGKIQHELPVPRKALVIRTVAILQLNNWSRFVYDETLWKFV